MTLTVGGRDLTSLCVSLDIKDNIYSCSSVMSCSIVFENHDGYLPPIFVYCGDEAVLTDNEEVIFKGMVLEVGVVGKDGIFSFEAYEDSHRLAKNQVYGIFSCSASENARRAIEACGLKAGALPNESCRPFNSYGGLTAKRVIDECYGDGYYIGMKDGFVGVYKTGRSEIGLNSEVIFNIVSKSSARDMVNFVSLTDSKDRVIYNTKSSKDISKYGQYRKYSQISQNTDAASYAKAALRGLIDKADITASGDFRLKKGCLVTFDLERYGLVGGYVIESVRHKVSGGIFISEIGVVKHGSIL